MKHRSLIHLFLLPLWLAGLFWIERAVGAERHLSAARAVIDQPKEHTAQLEEAIRLNPYHGVALAAMGRVMTAREDWPQVLHYTDRALNSIFYTDLIRQKANALFQLGALRGEFRMAALEEYRKFLLFLPDDRDSLYRLAHLYLLLDQPRQAETLARYCLRIHPPASDIWYDLNVIQARQGRHREAIHSVHRFLLLGPSHNLGPEVFERYDWTKHLNDWNRYLRLVESGRITPQKGGTLQTDRGRGPRS